MFPILPFGCNYIMKISVCYLGILAAATYNFCSCGLNSFSTFVFVRKMDSPPTYTDLGKAAKDIFSKGYGE